MLSEALTLVLHAALDPRAQAEAAWARLVSLGADVWAPADGAGGEVRRLLPLVAKNLADGDALDPRLPEVDALERARRDAFLGNAALVAHALPVLRTLGARGVRSALLKGAALLDEGYGDWSARVLSDVDVLVERRSLDAALAALAEAGFAPEPGALERLGRALRVEHALGFASVGGGRVDLHWNPLRAFPWSGFEADHWRRARRGSLEGAPVWTLDRADQLFIACVHARHDRVQRARVSGQWAADAAVLMRAPLDWERLVELARDRGFAATIVHALGWLARELDVAPPVGVLDRLARERARSSERVDAAALRLPAPAREVLCELARYLRMRREPRYAPLPGGVSRYLADAWALPDERAVAGALAAKLWSKVARRRPPYRSCPREASRSTSEPLRGPSGPTSA